MARTKTATRRLSRSGLSSWSGRERTGYRVWRRREIKPNDTDREELARIVAAPGGDDGYWLSSEFDDRIDALAEG